MRKLFKNVENWVFFPSLLVTVLIAASLIFFRDGATRVINRLFAVCTGSFGWLYYLACLACFGCLIWITFSPFGSVVLGDPKEGRAYSDFSWVSMLFTAGVGTSLVILGFLEPIYYVSDPPLNIAPFTIDAYEYAHMYGQFHWGMSAWAFYVPATAAVGYSVFVKKKSKLSLSVVCEDVLEGRRIRRPVEIIIDIMVVFGIIGSITTSLGIGTPVVSALLMNLFGIRAEHEFIVNIAVLIIWVCIFGGSVYLGLDRGIRVLSDVNVILAASFMAFVFLCSDMGGTLKAEINSFGLFIQNFVRINTWMDPYGSGAFVENWTVFYWGWWIAFMPMMGIFIARISRGRTIRSTVWGQLLWGSAGCALTFMIFGAYSLQIQQSGAVNLAEILNTQGQTAAMMAILDTLPLRKLCIALLCIVLFVYLATTIDSCAFVLASTTTRELRFDQEPARWNRLLWAIVFCVMSIGILLIGGFKAMQSVSIIAGFPLIAVVALLIVSCVNMAKKHK